MLSFSLLYPQALLTRLLSPLVGKIVGEEDGDAIDITTPPFRAGQIIAPAALEGTIVRLRERVDSLAETLPRDPALQELTAFIDPIDGTKEFCTGKGEQCSIMIGFADGASGQAVAGLVYRPLCPQQSWALGCAREGTFEANLRRSDEGAEAPTRGSFLVSNSGNSAFLDALRTDLGYEACPAGGAGNKGLLVLEQPSAVYIQDRGVSRWDTCAPQAVLEAKGGLMVMLQPVVQGEVTKPPTLTSYTYRAGGTNADFVAGVARLTKYNSREGVLSEADLTKGAPPRYAETPEDLKPYANTLGLLALKTAEPQMLETLRTSIERVANAVQPAFD